jgi:phospholipid-translocating ATPase
MAPKQDGHHPAGPGTHATQRSRWATRKLTGKSSSLKRLSLMAGIHKRSTSEKRTSGGADSLRPREGGRQNNETSAVLDEEGNDAGRRKLFFNIPLPDDLRDEDGHPTQRFTRNKIRTAKYTPLSFIPKNLWFQFHNVANIFFLFMVILVVSPASARLLSCPVG